MRKIVLIDRLSGGHHESYLERIAIGLNRMGYPVAVVAPGGVGLVARIRHRITRADLALDGFDYAEWCAPPKWFPARNEIVVLLRWMAACYWVYKARVGRHELLALFAWVDDFASGRIPAFVIDTVFPHPWVGLLFHPREFRLASGGKPSQADSVRVFTARRCLGLAVLDSGVSARVGRACEKPVVEVPDLADGSAPDPDSKLAAKICHLANGRTIVGVVGSLEKRKGILTLLEAARRLPEERWCFVVVGELYPDRFSEEELARVVNQERPNVFRYFGRLADEAEFNAVINAVDIVFAAYDRFPHSSNLISKAVAFHKPVIVSSGYYMAEVVKKYALGEIIDEGDGAGCADALQKLAQNGRYRDVSQFGFSGYQADHSSEKFDRSIQHLVTLTGSSC